MALTSFDFGTGEFIVDEPTPECLVVIVNVVSGVDEVGISPLSLGQRVLLPRIVGVRNIIPARNKILTVRSLLNLQ